MIKRRHLITVHQYYNPVSFVQMVIDGNYVVVIRQDRSEYLRDFLIKKFQIPMYISQKIYQGLTGFPMSKNLNKIIRTKIDNL